MKKPKTENVRTLLIVDDEPEIRNLLRDIAESLQLRVQLAGSGHEALQIVAREPITAILSDMNMPGGDGTSMLYSLRSAGIAIPCAFITAYETRDSIQNALRLGSYEFLSKPFEIPQVESLMSRIMALGSSIQHEHTQSPILRENAFHQAMAYKKLLKAA